jgi:hypothetical protein
MLGWCRKKNFQIHDPFKRCTVGKEGTHSIHTEGMNLLKWLDRISEVQMKRRLAVMKWRSERGWNSH